ncbi:MAG: hypothetical protein RJB38_2121 [Pseudomonadota bacterium]|jgi:hypothetical protein
MVFKTRYIAERLPYYGPELRPHFILSQFGIPGSAVIAFRGACSVKTDSLVDWEDRLAHDSIQAREMVHFLGEFFEPTLRETVWTQRLFVSILADLLREKGVPVVLRQGDDLFVKDRKLSVSIVTSSAVSQLLHLGINVDPEGAPVPAIGLAELGVDPDDFAQEALKRFVSEYAGVWEACTKVQPV